MFGNIFNRNSGDKKANNFENTKKLVTSNPDLSERLKNIFEPKKEEIKEIFVPNYLTQEEIDNLPNITDWEDLVDMKDRTKWVDSPYKDDVVLQRMAELLPNKIANIGEAIDDVKILFELNHDLSYKKELNSPLEKKLLSFLPSLLPKVKDLKMLDSWYNGVENFYWFGKGENRELVLIVENRLRELIWGMSGFELSTTRDSFKNSSNNVDRLIDERELEIILQEGEWNTLYKNRDSKRILKRNQSEKIAQGIYDIISNKTIQFTQKDISNIFEKMEQNSTIISKEITDALLNYFSDINSNQKT